MVPSLLDGECVESAKTPAPQGIGSICKSRHNAGQSQVRVFTGSALPQTSVSAVQIKSDDARLEGNKAISNCGLV